MADGRTTMADEAGGGRWPVWLRVGFRLMCLYLGQTALGVNHKTLAEKIPVVGGAVQGALNAPYLRAAAWMAGHVFQVDAMAAVPHASGFGDRALDWITAGIMLAVALLGTVVWSVLDRRRLEYGQAWRWLRLLLRVTLALAMLWYGAIKLSPVQIETPSLATLNEPVGQLSPMTLLWTLLGSNHGYERVCGLFETACGLLLAFRRTALCGAMLGVVIMANVVLFDVFFDVPVRLYATNLLMMAAVICGPDLRALFTLLLTRRAAKISSEWTPWLTGTLARYGNGAVTVFLLLVFARGAMVHPQYDREAAMSRRPSALAGQWRLDGPRRFVTPNGSVMTDLFLEPSGRDTVRAEDGTLHGGGTYAPETMTISLASLQLILVEYTMQTPDAEHLVLQPRGGAGDAMRFVRVPLPGRYPLMERPFSLSSEFGYEH